MAPEHPASLSVSQGGVWVSERICFKDLVMVRNAALNSVAFHAADVSYGLPTLQSGTEHSCSTSEQLGLLISREYPNPGSKSAHSPPSNKTERMREDSIPFRKTFVSTGNKIGLSDSSQIITAVVAHRQKENTNLRVACMWLWRRCLLIEKVFQVVSSVNKWLFFPTVKIVRQQGFCCPSTENNIRFWFDQLELQEY